MDISSTERRALALSFERALREIPSVRRATVGRRRMHGARYEAKPEEGFPYAAIIEFEDLAGLQAYLQHHAHSEPAELFFAAIDRALILDYEMIDGAGASSAIGEWLD